jgi:hypothetical protein
MQLSSAVFLLFLPVGPRPWEPSPNPAPFFRKWESAKACFARENEMAGTSGGKDKTLKKLTQTITGTGKGKKTVAAKNKK